MIEQRLLVLFMSDVASTCHAPSGPTTEGEAWTIARRRAMGGCAANDRRALSLRGAMLASAALSAGVYLVSPGWMFERLLPLRAGLILASAAAQGDASAELTTPPPAEDAADPVEPVAEPIADHDTAAVPQPAGA